MHQLRVTTTAPVTVPRSAGIGHPAALPESVRIRVALLTPYAGTNLGDAAIQEATIRNIRRRHPGAVISGITLNPEVTGARHGIPCFPIDARWLAFASSVPGSPSGPAPVPAGSRQPSLGGRVRTMAKRLPLLGPALRTAARVGRVSWYELAHLARGYRFARRHDAIVAAGGGQLDDEWGGAWAHPYALLKWALLSRAAGTPFIALSVGASPPRSVLSRWFMRWALRLACYRSYRDQRSKALLRDLPFTHGDRCVPDLAFSLPREGARPGVTNSKDMLRRVGVSPIAYAHPRYWPTVDAPTHERYLSELTEFVAWLAGRGHEVVLFATGGIDHTIISEIMARLTARAGGGDSLRQVRVAKDATLAELLAELDGMDAIVASRLHGVILAHVLGKPALAISFDRKVDAHMQEAEMTQYNLDIRTFDRGTLAHTFTRLERDARRVRVYLGNAGRARREALDVQYDALFRLLIRHRNGRVRPWR